MPTWKKYFFTIAAGQAISMIGSSAVQFSLIWWIAQQTNSPIMMGIAGFMAFFPNAIFGAFAGMLADRYNRKWICIISDLSIGIAASIFAFVMHSVTSSIYLAFVLILVRSIGSTFHSPAFQAMTPQYVPKENLLEVGGYQQIIMSGSFILGPVLGAFLYAHFSLPTILITDLIGAIFASVMLMAVPLKIQKIEREEKHFLLEIKEGIEVFFTDQKLGLIVLADTLAMFFFLPLSSYYPLMTSSYFSLGAYEASIVELFFSLGMLCSAFLISRMKIKHHIFVAYLGLFGMGLTSLLSGLLPPSYLGWMLFVLICAFMGGSGNFYGIPITVYLQTTVDHEKMGRVFSVFSLLSSFAMPIGLVTTAPLAQAIGIHGLFFVAGIGIVLIASFFAFITFIKLKSTH